MKHQLEKIKWGIIPLVSYRGVLVTKIKEGYSVLNKHCKTVEEVDVIIDNAENHIKKSLQKHTTQ